jgi:hypothetical protein
MSNDSQLNDVDDYWKLEKLVQKHETEIRKHIQVMIIKIFGKRKNEKVLFLSIETYAYLNIDRASNKNILRVSAKQA